MCTRINTKWIHTTYECSHPIFFFIWNISIYLDSVACVWIANQKCYKNMFLWNWNLILTQMAKEHPNKWIKHTKTFEKFDRFWSWELRKPFNSMSNENFRNPCIIQWQQQNSQKQIATVIFAECLLQIQNWTKWKGYEHDANHLHIIENKQMVHLNQNLHVFNIIEENRVDKTVECSY